VCFAKYKGNGEIYVMVLFGPVSTVLYVRIQGDRF
ncbi:MAG: 1,4-dihydroxy-2-naphthoate octaprenyltransferase, partial [Bacillariaceae sp.]|jgi:1,4-dihydroxy-2-naphthoate octaprenyltransferase